MSTVTSSLRKQVSISWPHKPKDYEWKGTIKETKLTRKILAHCNIKHEDVIIESMYVIIYIYMWMHILIYINI